MPNRKNVISVLPTGSSGHCSHTAVFTHVCLRLSAELNPKGAGVGHTLTGHPPHTLYVRNQHLRAGSTAGGMSTQTPF